MAVEPKPAAPDAAAKPAAAAPTPPPPREPPQPQLRRGRGRPPNADRAQTMAHDANPAQDNPGGATAGAASPGPAGERPKSRKKAPGATEVEKMAEKLVIYHAVIATFAKAPELQINMDEAKLLAASGLELAAEFDLEIGGRWAVAASFALTAAGIYLPRVLFMSHRMAQQRAAEAAQNGPGFPGDPAHNAPTINPDGTRAA